jgi:endonuclease-3 related protein
MANLPADAPLFNEYHALIVQHGKEHCRKNPRCTGCSLHFCPARN